jgi:hypothetical protein
MRSILLPLALLLALPSAVGGQLPRITPKGDPSIRADTVYRLAVDPAAYPEQSTAILLDDGVVSVEADGRSKRTYRMVVQILKPEAEGSYQERRFSYAPGHQKLTVNWVRVVRPNGEVISEKPSHTQDSDVPARHGNPVYSDTKVRRMSLTGVKAGTIVDWSYTIEELKPYLPGDFYLSWAINPGAPVLRSRYMVDAPATLDLRILERNLDFQRETVAVGNRRIHSWVKADIPAVKDEAFAADSNEVYMSVTISSPQRWSDIASWYAGHARSRYSLTPALERQVSEMVAEAATLEDTIRAVHRWVAQDIRYVSIALGLGGYQPRPPEEVVRTGFGDCKDKATLFIAALARLGVTAFPVLLNSDGGVDRTLPSLAQLDHAIAAVRIGDRYVYTDLTADLVPYGEIPFSYQDEFGIVVHPDGTSEEITFPLAPLEENSTVVRIAGTISEEGIFAGEYVEESRGASAGQLRDGFKHPLDSAKRTNAANSIARNFFDGAVGDSLVGFNGKDLSARPAMRMVIREGRAAEAAGNTMVLRLPVGNMRVLADAARELENEPKRLFPIDPAQFWGHRQWNTELRFTLPDGWSARLPKSVSASSEFGSYKSEYKQVGNELIVSRTTSGASGIQPPESIGSLIAWLRAVAADDARMIVLEKSAVLQAGTP